MAIKEIEKIITVDNNQKYIDAVSLLLQKLKEKPLQEDGNEGIFEKTTTYFAPSDALAKVADKLEQLV